MSVQLVQRYYSTAILYTQITMDNAVLEIVLKARDEASKTIEDVGKKAGGTSEMLSHSFKDAAIVSGVALGGLTVAAVESVKAFSEHQSILAQTDAVLKSTSVNYGKAQEALAAHSVTVGISTKEHAKLQTQLDAANYSLLIAQDHWDATSKHSKAATDSIAHAREKVSELQAAMGKTSTTMVGGGGLVPAIQITKDEVIGLSEKLQDLTTYSHDQVLASENLLLTFTSIGRDVFPKTQQTVLDVATAMHEDLQSASIQVGKAMQDPATGMAQLHRIGVNFTKQQIEQAKAMMAVGDVAGAQAIVLKELGTEFGGSAAAQVNTFAGRMTQLKNVTDDLKETFGEMIVKVLEPILPKVISFVTIMTDWIKNGTDVNTVVKALHLQLGAFGDVLGKVITFFASHRSALIALAGAFGGILSIAIIAAVAAMLSFISISAPVLLIFAAVGAGVALIVTHWKTFKPVADEVIAAFMLIATAIGNFVTKAFKDIMKFINDNKATFQAFWTDIVAIFRFSLGFIQGFWQSTWQAFAQYLQDIWQIMKGILEVAWGVITIIIDIGMGLVTGKWNKAWEGIKKGFGYIWDGIKDVIAGGVKYLVDSIKLALDTVIGLVNGVIAGFNKVAGAASGGKIKIPEIPHFQDGGFVPATGLAVLHAGEFVLSKAMIAGQQSVPQQVMSSNTNNNMPINIYATVNNQIDMNLLGNKIAFALRNSR